MVSCRSGGGELLVDAQPARPCSWHAAHPLFQNIGDGPARLLALSHFWHGRFFEGVTLLPSDSFDQRCWDTRLSDMLHFLYENDPLAERVLGITSDAIRRFLKPGGRLLPSGLKILGQPLQLPDEEIGRRLFRQETVDSWTTWYGLDFGPLAGVTHVDGSFDFVNPRRMRNWTSLTEPVVLAEMDFATWDRPWIRTRKTSVATSRGRLDGVVVYFELMAGRRPFLSTRPATVKKDNHWLSPLYIFADPETVQPGEPLTVSFEYELRTGESFCAVGRRR